MNNKISFSHRSQEPENSVLYVVGTPIGNLNDISLRALEILKKVSFIACEDTRQTKKIMNKFALTNKLISFNKFNSFKKIPNLIKELKQGKSIALVSDAGMPSICDPGEDFINSAKLNKIDVICVPGPCAAITALVSSGMPSSSFIFEGFLPKRKVDRNKILLEISNREKTTIIYEAPHRLIELLKDLKYYCGGQRGIQVHRELTKKYEQNVGNNINEVYEYFNKNEIMGEITILITGFKKTDDLDIDKSYLKRELHELVDAGLSLSSASRYLAKKKNIAKSIIYNLY